MGYNKTNWVNGDVITAEKLNHIESGIESNITGYEVSYESVLIFEGSLTTVNSNGMNYVEFEKENTLEKVDSLIVTIDGTEYELPNATPDFPTLDYGETIAGQGMPTPVFDNYPCYIMDYGPVGGEDYAIFATEEAGTYQVKIEYYLADVDVSENFISAVNEVVLKSPLTISLIRGVEENDITVSSTSWSAILEAFNDGRDIVLFDGYFNRYLYPISFIKNSGQDISTFCYINYDSPGDGTLSKIEIYQLYNNGGSTSLSYSSGSFSSSSSDSPK